MLLRTDIDIWCQNRNSFTALMVTVQKGEVKITKLLLGAGGKPTRKNKHGHSANDLAQSDEMKLLLN